MSKCIWVQIVVALLVLTLIVYFFAYSSHKHETFHGFSHDRGTCNCKYLDERECCACSNCAWYIDHNFIGRCTHRGRAPDSCLNRRPPIYNPYYYPYSNHGLNAPNTFSWYTQSPHESCLVKDAFGHCIEDRRTVFPNLIYRGYPNRRTYRRWFR